MTWLSARMEPETLLSARRYRTNSLPICRFIREGKAHWVWETSFALSIARVTEADDKTPGFVRNYANKWVSRTSALVKPTPTKGASTQLSCFQDIGFCHSKVAPVKNRYKLIVDNLRKIVADHRKHHLVKGRNKGPSVSIQHPLVLMSTKSSVMLN